MHGVNGCVGEYGVQRDRLVTRLVEIPLADAGSLTTGPNADGQASFEINRLPKPSWRIREYTSYLDNIGLTFLPSASLARIIVYSMAPDAMPSPASNAPTPLFTPLGSGTSTPLPHQNGGLGDYLSAPLGKGGHLKAKTYLAGCKALDSLVKLIASTESFFHPTNSGNWTNDVCLHKLSNIVRNSDTDRYSVERIYQVYRLRFQ